MKAFYDDIEPYQISVAGKNLTVLPMEDGVYRVCHKEKILADLYPEITAAGIFWNGFGQLPPWLAQEIGHEIYACEI